MKYPLNLCIVAIDVVMATQTVINIVLIVVRNYLQKNLLIC